MANFDKSDLPRLVNALSALGATSEQNAKVPSVIIGVLTSPEDGRLRRWLRLLKFPGEKDSPLLSPFLEWNDLLEMWLKPGAVDRLARVDQEAAPMATIAVGRRTRTSSRAGAVRAKAERDVARRTTKAKPPAKEKKEAKASPAKAPASEATLSDMIAKIKTEFGLAETLTMVETLVEAELQLHIDAGNGSIKERAQNILGML